MPVWANCFVSFLLMTSTAATGGDEDAIREAAKQEFKLWFKTEFFGINLTVSISEGSIKTITRKNIKVALVNLELRHGFASKNHDYVYITMLKLGVSWQLSGVGPVSKSALIGISRELECGWTFAWNTNIDRKDSLGSSKFVREKVFSGISNGTNTIRVYKRFWNLYFEAYRTPENASEKLMYTSPGFSTSTKVDLHIKKYNEQKLTAFKLGPWTDVSADLENDVQRFTSFLDDEYNQKHKLHKIRQFGDTPDRFFLSYKVLTNSNCPIDVVLIAARHRSYETVKLRPCSYTSVKSDDDIEMEILRYLDLEGPYPFLAEIIHETSIPKFESFLPWIQYYLAHLNIAVGNVPHRGKLELISGSKPEKKCRVSAVFAQVVPHNDGYIEAGYILAYAVVLNNEEFQLEALWKLDSESEIANAKYKFGTTAVPVSISNWYNNNNKEKKKEWERLSLDAEKSSVVKMLRENQMNTQPTDLIRIGQKEKETLVSLYSCKGGKTLCVVWDDKDCKDAFEIDFHKRLIDADIFYYLNDIMVDDIFSDKQGKYKDATLAVRKLIVWRSVVGGVRKLKVRDLGSLQFLIHTFNPTGTQEDATVIFAVINTEAPDDATRVLYVSPPLNEASANRNMTRFMQEPKYLLEEWTLLKILPDTTQTEIKELKKKPLSEICKLSEHDEWKELRGIDFQTVDFLGVRNATANGNSKEIRILFDRKEDSVKATIELSYNSGNLSFVDISKPELMIKWK